MQISNYNFRLDLVLNQFTRTHKNYAATLAKTVLNLILTTILCHGDCKSFKTLWRQISFAGVFFKLNLIGPLANRWSILYEYAL